MTAFTVEGRRTAWRWQRGAWGTTIPSPGPLGQGQWKAKGSPAGDGTCPNRVKLVQDAGSQDRALSSDVPGLGQGSWEPQNSAMRPESALLLKTQAKQAVLPVSRRAVWTSHQTKHTCFFLSQYFPQSHALRKFQQGPAHGSEK